MLEHTRRKQAPPLPPAPAAPAGPPPFPWLTARIAEERERRRREAEIHEKLPEILNELYQALTECVELYRQAFGPETAGISLAVSTIRITVSGAQPANAGSPAAQQVEVVLDPKLPGVSVRRASATLEITVGILPGGKPSYLDGDLYLTIEDLTRRILDPVFFPMLPE